MAKRINKKEQENIAKERITQLFELADKVFSKNKKLANRYVQLARKIAMKVRVRIPGPYKRRYCKHCYCYLRPSVNCRVRVDHKVVSYYCFNCGKYMRFPYVKEKKKIKK